MRVAFLGLGVMGYPMAGHLKQAGLDVVVYNRTASKAEQWVGQYGGRSAATPAEAADGAELVFACVGNDADVRQVTVGAEGAFHAMASGSLFIDHTTASAQLARELADEAQQRQIGFMDAPVSGGQAGAENGVLTIMCGGEDQHFQRARPVLEHYARATQLLGPVGSGQLAKMVNQICIAGVVQGLSEAVLFAEQAGLDGKQLFPLLAQGAAGSWQMENRHSTMIDGEYDFGFAVDWMRKDLGIVLDEARASGVNLPLTALVDQFYSEVQQMGGNRWDTSSLLARLQKFRRVD
ncbi:NAD(P)-dependent oxidoreductase [Porticoccus sp. W117]|uniref:NAD(P)-dependent oxidoreductase n=1 Tax=Porticoccus sp. W117 TaxID=3054777 RepID=UPI00259ADA0B|nr:NAD(P)-dependent oxidoreductase [Porticoccus sp. W117]MDM3869814.1 NAD(P)-dependent oxidoreductase [Porticoccus sp. W117]